jgi:hypothetical protein
MKLGVFCPSGVSNHSTEAFPLFIGKYCNSTPPILTLTAIDAMGRSILNAVSVPSRLSPIHHRVKEKGFYTMHHGLMLGYVKALSLACSTPILKGSNETYGVKQRGYEVCESPV